MGPSRQERRLYAEDGSDRRRAQRFPVCEELRYRVLRKNSKISGTGRTLNIGSGGVLFSTEVELPVGRSVEVAVNWPARLDGTCPLQFVAVGRVTRSTGNRAAIRFEKYEFRTRASGDRARENKDRLAVATVA